MDFLTQCSVYLLPNNCLYCPVPSTSFVPSTPGFRGTLLGRPPYGCHRSCSRKVPVSNDGNLNGISKDWWWVWTALPPFPVSAILLFLDKVCRKVGHVCSYFSILPVGVTFIQCHVPQTADISPQQGRSSWGWWAHQKESQNWASIL